MKTYVKDKWKKIVYGFSIKIDFISSKFKETSSKGFTTEVYKKS